MVLLEASIRALSWVNGHLLRIGYGIGIAAIAMMVAVTLVQVFFRYVLNNALPWPDEAARFGMLWMTGLMAPIAFRRGGFVAIDILIFALPRAAAAILNIMNAAHASGYATFLSTGIRARDAHIKRAFGFGETDGSTANNLIEQCEGSVIFDRRAGTLHGGTRNFDGLESWRRRGDRTRDPRI